MVDLLHLPDLIHTTGNLAKPGRRPIDGRHRRNDLGWLSSSSTVGAGARLCVRILASSVVALRCGCFPRPNVRVEAGPTARRRARAGENVPCTTGPGRWLAVGPRLERGVRPHAQRSRAPSLAWSAARAPRACLPQWMRCIKDQCQSASSTRPAWDSRAPALMSLYVSSRSSPTSPITGSSALAGSVSKTVR